MDIKQRYSIRHQVHRAMKVKSLKRSLRTAQARLTKRSNPDQTAVVDLGQRERRRSGLIHAGPNVSEPSTSRSRHSDQAFDVDLGQRKRPIILSLAIGLGVRDGTTSRRRRVSPKARIVPFAGPSVSEGNSHKTSVSVGRRDTHVNMAGKDDVSQLEAGRLRLTDRSIEVYTTIPFPPDTEPTERAAGRELSTKWLASSGNDECPTDLHAAPDSYQHHKRFDDRATMDVIVKSQLPVSLARRATATLTDQPRRSPVPAVVFGENLRTSELLRHSSLAAHQFSRENGRDIILGSGSFG
jgi:hypothetical protein